jgi:NDP-sugar pyrophosphorylase family protein
MRQLAERGALGWSDVDGTGWVDIDTPADMRLAERLVSRASAVVAASS